MIFILSTDNKEVTEDTLSLFYRALLDQNHETGSVSFQFLLKIYTMNYSWGPFINMKHLLKESLGAYAETIIPIRHGACHCISSTPDPPYSVDNSPGDPRGIPFCYPDNFF